MHSLLCVTRIAWLAIRHMVMRMIMLRGAGRSKKGFELPRVETPIIQFDVSNAKELLCVKDES